MPIHPFDAGIRLDTVDDDIRRGRTHPAWASMVGPFGGITAAALLHAVETHPNRIGEPLALTVNFAAPIVDGNFDISVRAARTNRTNQHWLLELSQHEGVKTTGTALFGIRRDTWADTEARPPCAAPPEPITRDSAQGDFVGWGRLYDLRFVEGPFPRKGAPPSPSATTTVWVRDAAGRLIDYPALAALCDVFCPRVFLRSGRPTPSGTVSLSIHFHAEREQLDALDGDYVLGTAHANRFGRGYFDQGAQLWSRHGVLLATSHQVVYFKGLTEHVRQVN